MDYLQMRVVLETLNNSRNYKQTAQDDLFFFATLAIAIAIR